MRWALKRMASTVQHQQYRSSGLSESDLLPDPIALFSSWLNRASESGLVSEPESVCLSTATPSGLPSSRYVLLRGVDQRGFVFFTNYDSRKGKELESNPNAAMAFYWAPLHQQVRVTGSTQKVDKEETRAYFDGRPLGSRVGAWASPQSRAIPGRDELARRVAEVEDRFGIERGSTDRETATESDKGVAIPPPDYWGGIRLVPREIEFWMGRPNRLHDRFLYSRASEGTGWKVERLGP